MLNAIRKHYSEVLSTIKLIDIEERFDLVFSRFFGLFFAKAALRLRMTPTDVSIASLAVGLMGGGLLYFQESWVITLSGSILITIAGVLDSADGQLARMSGQSTDLGRIIDGLIDNLVFLACYIAGTIAFLDVYGWWIFLIAALAGYAHSAKSGIYDFYKSEYLYYILHGSDNRIPLKKDLKAKKSGTAFERVANLIYFDYCRKLLRMTSRSDEDRKRMENLSLAAETKEAFQSEYRKLNGPLMFWWALICGTNTHRTLIMALSIAGRFDIYLIIAIVTYIPVLFIEKAQKRNDQKLLNSVTLA